MGKIVSDFRTELFLLTLLTVEFFLLIFVYEIVFNFGCNITGNPKLCSVIGSFLERAIVIFAALTIFFVARPDSFVSLPKNRGNRRKPMLLVHLAGVILLFVPITAFVLWPDAGWENRFALPWLFGSLLASVGIVLWYVSPADWMSWLRRERFIPFLIVGLAFITVDLAVWGRGLWGLDALARLTFDSVVAVLFHLGGAPFSVPEDYRIGLGNFTVLIADGCSGIEGFVLISTFVVLYGIMFREELRFPHYLIMIPLGIAVSWAFNVLRIALLIWIGNNVSPELAIEGFHSYAGWIAFTLLSLAVLWGSNTIPWFLKYENKRAVTEVLPLAQDWNAARLFPFVAFMLSGVFTSAFFTVPAIGYPIKALCMAAALVFFWRQYRDRIAWSIDWIAVASGGFIGILWLVLLPYGGPDDSGLNEALYGLGGAGFTAWVLMRIAGTVLLVPLIEELVFRGYIMAEINKGDVKTRTLAIVVSTVLFALLHGRWIAAGIAGLVFALVYLRRGKLVDAIVAHMIANFTVAVWAVAHQNWEVI